MCETLSNSALDVLFFIKKAKLLKNGEASICMRITVNSHRAEIMIKRSVSPGKWNQKKECATGNDNAARELNHFIEVYRTKVYKVFRQLEMDGREITARTISDILLGREDPEKPKTLVELYAEHNAQVWSLIGVDFAEVTAKKFDTSLLRLKEYLAHNYKADDITLEKVDNKFVRNYDVFLKTRCGCHHNSALKHLKNHKKIVGSLFGAVFSFILYWDENTCITKVMNSWRLCKNHYKQIVEISCFYGLKIRRFLIKPIDISKCTTKL